MILSTSSNGLQKSLNKLNTYCDKWKLQVNLSKSKTMCLNKQGKSLKFNPTLGAEKLECVDSYTYLGFEISNSCSLRQAEKSLYDKAQRAMFKLKSLLYGTGIKPPISLKMFDQLIKPICLYGSELWGLEILNIKKLDKYYYLVLINYYVKILTSLSADTYLVCTKNHN